MYLFGLKMGWIEKVVAVTVLTTLIASAFPASFFVANAAGEGPAEVVAPIVIIDVCENLPEVQTEVPEGYSNDGDYCFQTPTYTITGHKYECVYTNEGYECDTPVAGWTISAQNGDSAPITTETDEMGFYSFTVTDGEWEVYEGYSPYWQHIYTWEDGESISNEACSFEFGEIYAPSVVAKTSVAPADAYCDFGNVHIFGCTVPPIV